MTAVKKSAAVAHPRRFACCFIFCLFFHSVVSLPVRFGFIFCSLGNSSAFSFGDAGIFYFLPLFGPAFLPFAHASSFLKTPGVPLSQSHIHPAKVSFCAARRLSFAAEAVLLGLCLSNREIFSRSQSLSLAPGILSLILPEFFPPNEGDCSRAVYIILCRQDCPPAHTAMVVPARLGLPRFGNTPFFTLRASIRSPHQTSHARLARAAFIIPGLCRASCGDDSRQ